MMDEISFKHVIPVQIRFSDVDQFGHMNNSVYFSLYDLAKTSYFKDVFGDAHDWKKFAVVVANINADFLSPVFFSDDIVIETSVVHLGNKSFTLYQRAVNRTDGLVKCTCRTVLVGYDVSANEPIPIPALYKKAVCEFEGKSLEELSR